jgi:hypothetical protein
LDAIFRNLEIIVATEFDLEKEQEYIDIINKRLNI